jgi:hypothetical protein
VNDALPIPLIQLLQVLTVAAGSWTIITGFAKPSQTRRERLKPGDEDFGQVSPGG